MNDLDYYSSTMDSFAIFDGPKKFFLPRVLLYFDDIIGTAIELYSDFTGERLAISEFNELCKTRKISPCYHLNRSVLPWASQVFVYHDFDHPDYCRFVSEENQQLPI